MINIVVCIKQVPDTTEVRIDPKTGTLIREGVPAIINPDDLSAVEEAIRIKETQGANVTVLTMGPQQAKRALREALAMGADQAILLTDRKFSGADTLATSRVLAAAIAKIEPAADLILAGRQAIDGDTAQVGPEIAEVLDVPQITYVEKLTINQEEIEVKKMLENGYEVIRTRMPALLTVVKELNCPRYMHIKGISDAFKKEIQIWDAEMLSIETEKLGLRGSPTRVRKSAPRKLKEVGEPIETTAKEAAVHLAEKLKELHII